MSEQTQTVAVTSVSPLRQAMQDKLTSISEKLSQIKVAQESPFKTNGEFRFNPGYTGNDPIYIHRVKSLEVLIGVLAAVRGHFSKYEEAAKVLELDKYPEFSWCGYSYEAWEHDIKKRAAIISQDEKVKALISAKQKLEQFLTEDDRLALALKDIDNLL